MRRAERFALIWRRTDTRAVLAIGGALVLALALQVAAISAHVSQEAVEQADGWLRKARHLLVSLDAEGASGESLVASAHGALRSRESAVRLLFPDAAPLQHGDWPDSGSTLPAFTTRRSPELPVPRW